jgi:hypothetical protein
MHNHKIHKNGQHKDHYNDELQNKNKRN